MWHQAGIEKSSSQVISSWCELERTEREAQIRSNLSAACPVANEAELHLLSQLLSLHPGERLEADKARAHAQHSHSIAGCIRLRLVFFKVRCT